jgi:hypothetical protein
MSSKKTSLLAFFLLLAVLISACNMPRSTSGDAQQTAMIETAVAQTVAAEAASTAQSGKATSTDWTATPGENPSATAEMSPSDTLAPTQTASETPLPCNLAGFVKDVNVPDGKVFQPGETFTKTWRLKNTGSCAWTSGYDIVFDGGDAMGAPSAVQLTSGTVNPGQNVDVSVNFTAPDDPGTYRGNWKLRDPSDVVFGIENSSSGYFWVEIKVASPTDTPEPVTETLQRDPARSKNMGPGGASSQVRVGIAPNGDPIRTFLDFDLSDLSDLAAGSTIQAATLDISNFSGESCFEFLHPLQVYQISYGSSPDYPGDFNKSPIATLASASAGSGISSPINIQTELQNFVDSNGAGHFQIRMELEHDDSGAAFSCFINWTDPVLTVTYLP